MAFCIWVCVWLAALASCSGAWRLNTPAELDAVVKDQATVVVAFVSPAQDKLDPLQGELEAAISASSTPLVAIDCMSNPDTCKAYDSLNYPAVTLFKNSRAVGTYHGPRRASEISAWLERVQRPALTELLDDSLNSFQEVDEVVFVAFLKPDDRELRAVFQSAAVEYGHQFSFGVSIGTDTDPAELPIVNCYKRSDGDTQSLSGPFDNESLESFIKEASVYPLTRTPAKDPPADATQRPYIADLLPHNHQRLLNRGWPMVYVFASTEAQRAEIREGLGDMARRYYGSLTIAIVDPLDFPDLPARLGLEPGVFPAGAVHQLSVNRIYPYPRDRPITAKALQKWGLDVWQGRVKPWTPPGTTPIPTQELPGHIKATRKVSMRTFPGMKINFGHEEL